MTSGLIRYIDACATTMNWLETCSALYKKYIQHSTAHLPKRTLSLDIVLSSSLYDLINYLEDTGRFNSCIPHECSRKRSL